jgi:hypothetical protein
VFAKQEYPPLFPIGFHDKSLQELREICVVPFKARGSSTRERIIDGLEIIVKRLVFAGVIGEIWVDGSFVTEKIDPSDVDILLMVDGKFFDNASPEQQEIMKWVQANLKTSHLCDSNLWVQYEQTHPAMARLNQMLRDAPDASGLIANMNTLKITHFKLEKEFEHAAKRLGVEICSYRLFPEGTERQSVVGIGKALLNFQSLFSLLYCAVKAEESGAGKPSLDETLMDFAYTFPGSVGVAMTVPSQANLFGNYYHQAIDVLSHMAKAQSASELKMFSQRVGIEPVKAMYKWADDLVEAGFGADIQWKGPHDSYPRLLIQKPELTSLKAVMRATSDEHFAEFTKTGILQGVDMTNHSFHFQYKDEKGKTRDIYGKFVEAISPLKPVKVPLKYTVSLRKSTRVFYSTDEEVTSHLLLRIQLIQKKKKKKKV